MKQGIMPKSQRVGTIYDGLNQCMDAVRMQRLILEVLAQIGEFRERYGDDSHILKVEATIVKASSELFEYTCTLGR